MSDVTITTINSGTQLITPADDDMLPITDVSDTTEAAAGTTKPIRVDNLLDSSLDRVVCVDNAVVCVDNNVIYI